MVRRGEGGGMGRAQHVRDVVTLNDGGSGSRLISSSTGALSPSTTEAVALGSSHQALVHRVPAAEQGVRQRGVLAAGVR